MPSSRKEESSDSEFEEGNDAQVVWVKSARGFGGFGHVFDGKFCFTRDICEEKWMPQDLASPKKSVPAPKVRAKPAPNRLVSLSKQVLNRLPNAPHAPLPPRHQPVPHTQCPSCKLNMCNSSECAILVPGSSTPFLWMVRKSPNNIGTTSMTLVLHQCSVFCFLVSLEGATLNTCSVSIFFLSFSRAQWPKCH